MNRWLIITLLAVGLAAAGGIIYGFIALIGDRSDLRVELAEVKATLAMTQEELGTTTTELSAAETDLTETRGQLVSTQAELDSVIDTLGDVRQELSETDTELSSTLKELSTTQNTLRSVENELEDMEEDVSDLTLQIRLTNETLQGLDITISRSHQCYDVVLKDNPEAADPTWAELKAFLLKDKTEDHEYIANVYDCSQFSRDVHNNAEAAGLRAAEVQISFTGESWGHALNAFLTTDYGLVYVDCTGGPDVVARIESGKEYRAVAVTGMAIKSVRKDIWWDSLWSYYYMPSDSGGNAVVEHIELFW